MTTFANATRSADQDTQYRAPRVILVPTSAFADDWPNKPTEDIEMGLRIITDDDLQTARDDAAARTARIYQDRYNTQEAIDSFNDALLRHKIARATCHVDDRRKPYFHAAEEMVRIALSTDGVKFLAHQIHIFELETSPVVPPADDEALADLVQLMLDGDPFEGMDAVEERDTRRLFAEILERIGAAKARVAAQDDGVQ